MISKIFKIKNKLGIHARPAAEFVKTASRFSSDVNVAKNDQRVNGKSIMGLLMLEAAHGTEIEVEIDGKDEQEAMEAMTDLIEIRQFDEE
jgi:phosphocarrier protein HPr